jgi:hypothetical protein
MINIDYNLFISILEFNVLFGNLLILSLLFNFDKLPDVILRDMVGAIGTTADLI